MIRLYEERDGQRYNGPYARSEQCHQSTEDAKEEYAPSATMRGGCSAFSIATGSGLRLGGDRLPEWVLRRIEELIHLLHLCLKLGGIVRLLLDMRCATVVEVNILRSKTHAIGTDKVLSLAELIANPIEVAAANWIATSHIVAEIEKDCIFVDTGSTTTDIIPIKEGKECAKGRTDFERSATGELVYTGTLRTNLTSFVDSIPFNGETYRVASELFAITADVYNVLDLIKDEDYVCATCDGAGKSKEESARRISRVVCADLDILSMDDIKEMADYIHKEQVKQIAAGLKEVSDREGLDKVIVTGLGKDILCAEAAKLLGLDVKSMGDFYSDDECTVAPAIGTAIMMKNYLD